jgi:SAM-dependent methyltransferase
VSVERPGLLIELAKNVASTFDPIREWIERRSARRAVEAQDHSRPFTLWQELFARTGGRLSVQDREVLELGPGRSLGLSLIFLAAGARRVYAVDRFRHLFWDRLDRRHIAGVLERLDVEGWPSAAAARQAVRDLESERVSFDPDLLIYRQADGAALPLADASVDLTYSNAVLEHVHQPDAVARELARVTRRGGDSVHEIDFRDHFVEHNRLRFLEFSEWEWQLRARLRPGYTNRLRVGDFQNLFRQLGFELLSGKVTHLFEMEEVEAMRPRWTSRFRERSAEELSTAAYWGWWRRL